MIFKYRISDIILFDKTLVSCFRDEIMERFVAYVIHFIARYYFKLFSKVYPRTSAYILRYNGQTII